MREAALEAVLRRGRIVVVAAPGAVTVLAWADLVWCAWPVSSSSPAASGCWPHPSISSIARLAICRLDNAQSAGLIGGPGCVYPLISSSRGLQ
jgi:predicted metal-binding membrane protein